MSMANQRRRAENSHTAIDTLVWLIKEAFEDDPPHSLLANLKDLREEDWTATPPGSSRSIADILEHVGWSKWMYEDYAFGSPRCVVTSLHSFHREECEPALMLSCSSG